MHEGVCARARGLACALMGSSLLWLAQDAAAAGGGKPATKLINVADTRALPPGLSRWIAEVYNDSYWLFALLVVVTMSGMGLLLGLASDRVMGLLGIHLGRMDHHE